MTTTNSIYKPGFKPPKLKKNDPKKFKGGFSDAVFKTDQFQKYAGGYNVCGYLGSSQRTKERDIYLESFLSQEGLGPNGIAVWLSSGDGRHLMDSVEYTTTQKEFEEQVNNYCSGAFVSVTVWSHPDHTGFLGSSVKLRKLISEKFGSEAGE